MATDANIVFGGVTVVIGADVGYVKDGVEITKSEEIYKPSGIEGLLTAPVARRTSEEWTCSFTMIEPTLANFRLAWDVAAATAGTGTITLDVGGDTATPTNRVLVVTSIEPGGTDVRTVTFGRVVSENPGATKFTQFEETAIPCVFVTLWDTANTRTLFFSDA